MQSPDDPVETVESGAHETDHLLEKDLDEVSYKSFDDSESSKLSIASNRSGLTYKKLSDGFFFWTATILQIAIVGIAMLISEIELVFEFTGTFGCATVTFLFPAVAYIKSLNTYGSNRQREKTETLLYLLLAWFFIAIFVAVLFLYFYLLFVRASGKFNEDASVVGANGTV